MFGKMLLLITQWIGDVAVIDFNYCPFFVWNLNLRFTSVFHFHEARTRNLIMMMAHTLILLCVCVCLPPRGSVQRVYAIGNSNYLFVRLPFSFFFLESFFPSLKDESLFISSWRRWWRCCWLLTLSRSALFSLDCLFGWLLLSSSQVQKHVYH